LQPLWATKFPTTSTFPTSLVPSPNSGEGGTFPSQLSFYQVLVSGGVLPASDGVSLIQNNIVKAQRYIYQDDSDLKMVIVGSSLAANLNVKDIGEGVKSIALGGGSSKTGLEIVKRSKSKPRIVLVEINDTIVRKIDAELVDSLYHPIFY
jgi:hypothetical protein